ncbi:MAG: hypothetical protein QXU95_01045 [Candidatus Bathyarchaeia archaeon]|nr:hypothetical protein [Candidatus Bathyarchaeota archaeon]
MKRTKRILNRFPDFYKVWDENSRIFKIINAVGKRLEEADKDTNAILRAHWVDTAFGEDIDRLGAIFNLKRRVGEEDSEYRSRLKRAIMDFKGGGTVSAILSSVKMTLGLPENYQLELVENPPITLERTLEVRTGDTWFMSSNSVLDAVPSITITTETADMTIINPTILNIDTGEKISFNGEIRAGEKLKMGDGRATLNGIDVTERLTVTGFPRLLRKGSAWKYSEQVEETIGRFDTSSFDESVFAVGIPTAKIIFNWVAYQPATFEIKIPKDVISVKRDLSILEEVVYAVKASGVKAIIKVI